MTRYLPPIALALFVSPAVTQGIPDHPERLVPGAFQLDGHGNPSADASRSRERCDPRIQER